MRAMRRTREERKRRVLGTTAMHQAIRDWQQISQLRRQETKRRMRRIKRVAERKAAGTAVIGIRKKKMGMVHVHTQV
tara:strand:- start:1802 stop:2032 length:231 start_codon:yes stop_codon:yes gene_type:complete